MSLMINKNSEFAGKMKSCPRCNEMTIRAREVGLGFGASILISTIQSMGGNIELKDGLSGDVIAWQICPEDNQLAYTKHECRKGKGL